MTFFAVKDSLEKKVVGTQYPQVWDFLKEYDPEPEANGIFSLYNMYYKPGFPKQELNLSGLKLSNGAQFTDFISNGFAEYLFILSPQAKSLMESVNIDAHRFYPAKITSPRKKLVKDYYLMKVESDNMKYIDFKNSDFVVQDVLSDDDSLYQITIDSLADYYEKREELVKGTRIRAKSIRMLPEFYDLNLDFFKISTVDFYWYISTKLYELIQQMNLTGLEFRKVEL